MVEPLFLVVPRGCLRFVIVVFPDHTHLLYFFLLNTISTWYAKIKNCTCQVRSIAHKSDYFYTNGVGDVVRLRTKRCINVIVGEVKFDQSQKML